jgi:hypothetical protein
MEGRVVDRFVPGESLRRQTKTGVL